MDQPDLRSPDNYINRELSLLEFNDRVLAQALDEKVPLLERLKFLCISSNNLDEFFEIRVAGLKQRIELGSDQPGPDGLTISEQLEAIHDRTRRLVDAQYACLNDVLLPALRQQGIELLARASWDSATESWLEQYFEREVEPVLSPLGLDPARPFPRIQNKSLNFIVRLAGKDAFGRDTGLAIVQAPRSLPRVVALPEEDGRKRFVLLTGIVQQFVSKLFSGMDVLGCYQFRVTRNSDLFVDDEEVDDLRRALEGELAHRRYGAAVRLEVSRDCPPDLDAFLMRQFTLGEVDFYTVSGPVNLNRLATIYDLVQRPDLKYPIFTPGLPRRVAGSTDLLAVIRQKDVLLHHPFHSFGPVLDFLRGAAADPRVLAIKQTLYRAGDESPIVDALVGAAQSGKDVTVIVELRARFDEEANIELSSRLQEAGAPVVTVYPGAVYGPNDPYRGAQSEQLRWMLLGLFPTFPRGALHVVDVRDVAAVIATVLQQHGGIRRYVVPGHHINGGELYAAVSEAAGRRLPHVILPGPVVVPTVRVIDAVQRRLPQRWHYPADLEGVEIVRRDTRFDDSAARTELGVDPTPFRQSIADTVRWLVESGRVSARRAPRLSAT